MKPFVVQRVVEARNDLGSRRFTEILAIADSPHPLDARELAAITDSVRSRYLLENGRTVEVPLGRSIFIEAVPNWPGSIDLADEVSLRVMQDYVGAIK
jgi:hypothetical protein